MSIGAAPLPCPDGGPVRVEATPGGPDGSVAIVLSVATPLVPAGAPDDWPLTAAERRVVDLALAGRSNVEIGEALFVSDQTVVWQLRQPYVKLGARSRTGLLARLIDERTPPCLLPDRAAPATSVPRPSGPPVTPRR